MKSLLLNSQLTPILAQAAGGLAEGASKAMGIVMLIGLIIAGAPVIVKALFTAFGLDGSTVDVGTFK